MTTNEKVKLTAEQVKEHIEANFAYVAPPPEPAKEGVPPPRPRQTLKTNGWSLEHCPITIEGDKVIINANAKPEGYIIEEGRKLGDDLKFDKINDIPTIRKFLGQPLNYMIEGLKVEENNIYVKFNVEVGGHSRGAYTMKLLPTSEDVYGKFCERGIEQRYQAIAPTDLTKVQEYYDKEMGREGIDLRARVITNMIYKGIEHIVQNVNNAEPFRIKEDTAALISHVRSKAYDGLGNVDAIAISQTDMQTVHEELEKAYNFEFKGPLGYLEERQQRRAKFEKVMEGNLERT